MKEHSYDAASVKSLEGVELIRARPTLFLDGLDSDGLHRLVFEAVDNAVDEFRAGFGREIKVRLEAGGEVSVEDAGRGIPLSEHDGTGVPIPVFLMTKAFAGAKFDSGAYSSSGGLHGVGLKCINAFSEWVELSIFRDGEGRKFVFRDGVFVNSEEGGRTTEGTTIRFLPKYEIFGGAGLDHDRLSARLSDAAHLNPGLRCVLEWEGGQSEHHSEGGVAGLLEARGCTDIFSSCGSEGGVEIDCHLGVLPHGDTSLISYANGIPTPEGGSHVAGAKSGLARAAASYAARRSLVKDSDPAIGPGDAAEGCALVVVLRMEAPPFSSQKKTKIISPEVESICSRLVGEAFASWLEASPAKAKHATARMLTAAKNREKLRAMKARLRLVSKAKKQQRPGAVLASPEKSDELVLSVKNPHWRTLAGNGSDVLPMRMKQSPPPNRTSLDKLLRQTDYFALAAALGAGVGSLDDDPEGGFKIEQCRYKVVTVKPGDSDSARLAGAFVLLFIEHHLPGLVQSERVYWDGGEGARRVTTAQSLKSEVSSGGEEQGAEMGEESGDGEGSDNPAP